MRVFPRSMVKYEQMEVYLAGLLDSILSPEDSPCGRSLQGSISRVLLQIISWAWPYAKAVAGRL